MNSNVTNLKLLFSSIPNVKSINLSGWDTSRVTNIYATFGHDKSLESVNISGWNLSNAKSIASLFDGDSNLSNIDLSNVNFGNNIGDNGDSFGHVGNKLSNVNLTNAKGIPEAVLRAWGQAAKNTKATELSIVHLLFQPTVDLDFNLHGQKPGIDSSNIKVRDEIAVVK